MNGTHSYSNRHRMSDWVQNKIDSLEYWLHINEKQMILPTMDEESALFKQEVSHKKEMLALLQRFKTEEESVSEVQPEDDRQMVFPFYNETE